MLISNVDVYADLMNLPILSQFVEKSIRGVLTTFTSPAWYSIDCSRLLVVSLPFPFPFCDCVS